MASLASLFGEDTSVVRDRSFQLLLLANLSPPLGTALVSPLLDSLVEPFAVTEAQIGLVVTVFTAPGVVLVPTMGVLSDRYGRKVVLVTGLVLFGAGGVGIAFTTDFSVVLALRFVQGVGFAGLTPVIVTSIGDLFEGGAEASAQGFRFASSGLVLMTLPLLGGVLVEYGWYYPFFIFAIAFPIAALFVVRFEEPTSVRSRSDGDARETLRGLVALVRQRRVWTVVVARGIPEFLFLAFLTYNSLVVVRLIGGSPTEAGLLVTVASIAHVISATQAGRITAMYESRFYPLLLANLCMGLGVALFGAVPALPVAVLASAGVGVGFGTTLSLYRSVITGFTTEELRGSLVSVSAALGRLGATLAPVTIAAGIALVEPLYGYQLAVRGVVASTGTVGALVGATLLLVARNSPEVDPVAS